MVEVAPVREWTRNDAEQARARYTRRQLRVNKAPASLRTSENTDTAEDHFTLNTPEPALSTSAVQEKQTAVQAALARARARRNAATS